MKTRKNRRTKKRINSRKNPETQKRKRNLIKTQLPRAVQHLHRNKPTQIRHLGLRRARLIRARTVCNKKARILKASRLNSPSRIKKSPLIKSNSSRDQRAKPTKPKVIPTSTLGEVQMSRPQWTRRATSQANPKTAVRGKRLRTLTLWIYPPLRHLMWMDSSFRTSSSKVRFLRSRGNLRRILIK